MQRKRRAVHPHGCGACDPATRDQTIAFGSSPRVWGVRHRGRRWQLCCRFIPTGVGRAASVKNVLPCLSVHPHGCGACALAGVFNGLDLGSSPRVWGVPRPDHSRRFLMRFIPTGVGRAKRYGCADSRQAVHPHGCGACAVTSGQPSRESGSSPRVWGVRRRRRHHHRRLRFIPTGVGRAAQAKRLARPEPVHPHGCGACRSALVAIRLATGSSPRVWGVPPRVHGQAVPHRFIPTGVGRAVLRLLRLRAQSVHPHGCGACDVTFVTVTRVTGSSPRVWGVPP